MKSSFNVSQASIDDLLGRTSELLKSNASDIDLLNVINEYLPFVDTHRMWMSSDIIIAPLFLYVKDFFVNNHKIGVVKGDAFGRFYDIDCSCYGGEYHYSITSESSK